MGPGETLIAIAGISAGVYVIHLFVRSISNYFSKRLEVRSNALTPAVDGRLARLEQAVDSIALEVERISEGQRFTTHLLSGRAYGAIAPPERSGSATTPH